MICSRWLHARFGFVDPLALIVCFIFYENWVQRALYGAQQQEQWRMIIGTMVHNNSNNEDRDPPSTYVLQCVTTLESIPL